MTNPWFILAGIYTLGFTAVLSAGYATEASFTNPNYRFVVFSAFVWPVVMCYFLGRHFTA